METPHPLPMMSALAVKEEWERQSPGALAGPPAPMLPPLLGHRPVPHHHMTLGGVGVGVQEPVLPADVLVLGDCTVDVSAAAAPPRQPPESCRCEQCGKLLSCPASLKRHQVVHSSARPHVCSECGRAFSTAAYLATHRSTHTQQRPHTCPVCGKGFTRSTGLNRHMELHLTGRRLPGAPPQPFTARTGTPVSASVPAAAHPAGLASEKPAAQCGVCGKHFTRALSVKAHMRIHTGERPHKCPLCDKAFKNASHLKVHSRTHTKEKNHACELCDKRFAESSSLRRHMLVHTGARPYECDICGKEIRYLSHLKAHRRKHTGETPYQCNLCGQLFRLYQTFRLHVKKHEGRLPTCDTCGKTFSTRTRRDEHAALHAAGVLNERGEAPAPRRPADVVHQPRLPLRLDSLLGRRPEGVPGIAGLPGLPQPQPGGPPNLPVPRPEGWIERRFEAPTEVVELTLNDPPPPPLPE